MVSSGLLLPLDDSGGDELAFDGSRVVKVLFVGLGHFIVIRADIFFLVTRLLIFRVRFSQ